MSVLRDEIPISHNYNNQRNVFTRKTLAQINLVINLVQNHLIRFPELQALVQKLLQVESAVQVSLRAKCLLKVVSST